MKVVIFFKKTKYDEREMSPWEMKHRIIAAEGIQKTPSKVILRKDPKKMGHNALMTASRMWDQMKF